MTTKMREATKEEFHQTYILRRQAMKLESVETKQHPQTPEQILREAFDKIRDQHNLILNNVVFRHSGTSSATHLMFCEIDANTRG